MANTNSQQDPLATLFGVVGFIVGAGYAIQFLDGNVLGAFFAGGVGFLIGQVIGAVVVRLMLIALVIGIYLLRDEVVKAIWQAFGQ